MRVEGDRVVVRGRRRERALVHVTHALERDGACSGRGLGLGLGLGFGLELGLGLGLGLGFRFGFGFGLVG